MPLGANGSIQLLGEREPWQCQAEPFGFTQGDPHVLDEMLHEEAGGEVSGED